MIRISEKEVAAIYFGQKAIQAVYKGAVLVWQAIRSCFGSGWWDNEKHWIDEDAWDND